MLRYLHITNDNIGLTFWEISWIFVEWMYLACSSFCFYDIMMIHIIPFISDIILF